MKIPEWAKTPAAASWGRTIAAAVPVVLVNVVAFAGQLAFLREHLPWPPAGQVMVALALESVAIYLAWHAHLAQLANDSALRLRLVAYGFALLIASANYSHYAAPGWRPTFAAVAVALCSAISPFLWGVYSRRVSRDRLIAQGLIEPHALRLGMTRWTWHPYRSARVMWLATWEGTTDPAQALAARYPREPQPAAALPPGPAAFPASQSSPPAVSLDRQSQAGTPARKPARKTVAKIPDAKHVAAIRGMPGFPEVKPTQVRDLLHVRFDTAKELLATARLNGHPVD